MDVAYAEPARSGYVPAPDGDRAWQVVEAEETVWCVVDASAQAALLEAVLGGPGAARPTSIERAIVSETIERLFMREGIAGSQLVECASERPAHANWWRCNVDLTPRRGRSATLQLFAPPKPAIEEKPPASAAPDLLAVPMFLTIEVAPIAIPLAQLLAWTPSALVPLPRESLAIATVGAWPNVLLASGRVGSIADGAGLERRALEITALRRSCNA